MFLLVSSLFMSFGQNKTLRVVNSELLSKRNVLEGADAVFCDGIKDTYAKSYSVP